jgi:hypothetical protein
MWLHVELEMLGVPYVVLDQANEPCPILNMLEIPGERLRW